MEDGMWPVTDFHTGGKVKQKELIKSTFLFRPLFYSPNLEDGPDASQVELFRNGL